MSAIISFRRSTIGKNRMNKSKRSTSHILCVFSAFPWLQVNPNRVCFGAKDDSYGAFTVPYDGNVVSLRLVYISGFVSCQYHTMPQGSHWGCAKESKLTTLVTNERNEVIFPRYNDRKIYSLAGYNYNSPELIFKLLSPPLKVFSGYKFRIKNMRNRRLYIDEYLQVNLLKQLWS